MKVEASSELEAIDPIQVTYTIADTFAVVGQSWRVYVARVLIFAAVLATVFVVLFTVLDGGNIHDSVRTFPWDVILALVSLILVLELGVFPLINHFLKKREMGPKWHSFHVLRGWGSSGIIRRANPHLLAQPEARRGQ